jgi:hypothetical protein
MLATAQKGRFKLIISHKRQYPKNITIRNDKSRSPTSTPTSPVHLSAFVRDTAAKAYVRVLALAYKGFALTALLVSSRHISSTIRKRGYNSDGHCCLSKVTTITTAKISGHHASSTYFNCCCANMFL